MFNKVISKSSADARAAYLERIRNNGKVFDVREDGEDHAPGGKGKAEYREDTAQKSVSSKDARARYLAGIKDRWVAAGGQP